ncbi:MAG: GIY-YIG nuclease family protein [Candidatus Marinimicrobia bacterium]|nr:GIY-YIG nuclease family protein [Candidatus Neomarinimicrobiota bacterium]
MASISKVLYTGVTGDLETRMYQHKNKLVEGFTKKYNIHKLVWYEDTDDVAAAIGYDKKIKGWLRKKKVALIEEKNPSWDDLAKDWFK